MIVPLTAFSFDKDDVVDIERIAETIVALTVPSVLLLRDATCIDEACFSEATVPVTKDDCSLGAGQEDGELVGFPELSRIPIGPAGAILGKRSIIDSGQPCIFRYESG